MTTAQLLLWQQMLAKSFTPARWWWDSEERHTGDHQPNQEDGQEEVKIMWVYRETRRGSYEVGYWDPDKKWFRDSIYASLEEATKRVHWLNGGGSEG